MNCSPFCVAGFPCSPTDPYEPHRTGGRGEGGRGDKQVCFQNRDPRLRNLSSTGLYRVQCIFSRLERAQVVS